MKRIFTLLLLLTGAASFAQNRKIDFKTIPLQEAMQQAKEQHKLIFMDCYTVWCIPCRQMEATVFKVDSVADFFNKTFINVKIDMEKGEGPTLLKSYTIGAFPSYLILNGDGKMLYKFVGGMPADKFMAMTRSGMQADNEVSVLHARYASGERSPDLLRALILLKIRVMEISEAKRLNDELMDLLTPAEKALPVNWVLFDQKNRYAMYLSNTDSRNFNYLADHWRDFAATNNKDTVDRKMSFIFRKLATESLEGYHFKAHPYVKAHYEHYKEQIRATQMPDKEQLIVLIDMAEAAGEKNPERVTAIFEKNIDKLSEDNLRVTWGYVTYCSSIPGYKYPRASQIADKIIKRTKNPYLVTTCNMLKQQQARANSQAEKGEK